MKNGGKNDLTITKKNGMYCVQIDGQIYSHRNQAYLCNFLESEFPGQVITIESESGKGKK